ncbi:transketolase-like TK C-terminal-containing protein [Ornithinimicrobium cavernae]|uniref:transketolase-like TK C-terminal-containing protein n=1 Tax=Ornithinimicrobium cavernae TaxID=2666047 RepID=UPI000D694543|nr:pyruvate dehydrogenase [Ornithinimicrobium cavernae]
MTQLSPQGGVAAADASPPADDATLRQVEDRVLWLSTAIIDHANRVRPNTSGLKVGGHQASCASMVTVMTDLWMRHLRPQDRVSVKPHASPVLHALNYVTGQLDADYLPTLRALGGLQSYPSRSKDPDPVDYSTGSVGIGATAPIWGAISRRYVAGLAEEPADRTVLGRQYSLLGDAELDEGAVWEAVLDPQVATLGEVVWVVDMNRQSLDRVAPRIQTSRFEQLFAAAGWQVITLRWGARISELFEGPGGQALRQRMESMPNPEYQRMLRRAPAELREHLPGDGTAADGVRQAIAGLSDEDLAAAFRDLGGHSLPSLDAAFAQIDDHRPTVILAYTVKGNRLSSEGHPQNHSSLLTGEQMADLAGRLGADLADPWAPLDPASPAGAWALERGRALARETVTRHTEVAVPTDFGRTPKGTATTQASLGRALLDLTRQAPEAARRVVSVSPDVSSSTNLAGWLNKVGLWTGAAEENRDWFADDPETLLHWRESRSGQHIELGIAEVNLVSLIGELGATWSRWGQPLLPIGVLYDPFVHRALEPWTYGIYAGGQSILVGTPSGVTLAPEGGAHQSITTPSVGLEQPGLVTYEPAFAQDTEWVLLASLGRLGRPDGVSAYLRLSTRPVDQTLADVPTDPAARERRRAQVVAGGYRLRRTAEPAVTLAAMGAVVPNAIQAADRLEQLGIPADVLVVTSPGLLYQALQARRGRPAATPYAQPWILDQLLPADRATPLVTVLDGHPHTLTFLGTVNQVPTHSLGVTEFGQSGDLDEVHALHGLDADAIVRSALDLTT